MKIFKNANVILSVAIISLGLAVGFIIIDHVSSAAAAAAVFPIAELGNCKSETECASFCDNKNNITACVNYAEKNGMISAKDAAEARKFAKIGAGPGGCKTQAECASYCDSTANLDACLSFASQNGLIDAAELQEAQKVVEVLKAGGKTPGGCKTKSECQSYCDSLDNMTECIDFAEKAGLIPEAELADAKKVAKALKSGQKQPGGCTNKKSCDNYCSSADHMEECVNFAIAADLIPPEEAEQVKKILPLMKAGKMPGGCVKKEQCDTYCADDSHIEECANFAIEAGFMKPEEVEMYKKTGGKGPGNCKSKEACEAFCDDPANEEACFNFALDKGLIPEAELQEMKAGQAQFKQGLEMATPEVLDCIKSQVGSDNLAKMQAGGMPSKQAGAAMGSCFSQLMKGPGGAGGGAGGPPAGFEKGPPSAEDIQKMVPPGVEITPEMMKNGPPSQDQIQGIIQQKMQVEMEKRGAPSGSGSGGVVPAMPSGAGLPAGQGGPPSAQDIQNMIQQNTPKNIQTGPPAGTQFGPPAGTPSVPPQ